MALSKSQIKKSDDYRYYIIGSWGETKKELEKEFESTHTDFGIEVYLITEKDRKPIIESGCDCYIFEITFPYKTKEDIIKKVNKVGITKNKFFDAAYIKMDGIVKTNKYNW